VNDSTWEKGKVGDSNKGVVSLGFNAGEKEEVIWARKKGVGTERLVQDEVNKSSRSAQWAGSMKEGEYSRIRRGGPNES